MRVTGPVGVTPDEGGTLNWTMDIFGRHRPDRHILERVLEGDPAVPAEVRPVARVLRAAAAPPYPEELRGEEAAVAAFRVAPGPSRPTRRAWSALLSVKALAVLVGAAATAGGVALAASTGVLPDVLVPETTASSPAPTRNEPRKSTPGVREPGVDGVPLPSSTTPEPAPPPSTVHDQCLAILAKDVTSRGQALKTAPYEELVRLAGGVGKVKAYCEALVSPTAGDPGSPGGGKKGEKSRPPEKSGGNDKSGGNGPPRR